MKRSFDVLLALLGLPLAVPLMLICGAAIRLTSSGPALFAQKRVGMFERPFTCYKLRTMKFGAGDAPTHEMATSAVTPLGKHLRRLKLDELPQLWNILRGEMSFVGPRPCLPSQTSLIAARRRYGLHTMRPGLTGVSQVLGIDMSDPERLAESDATYLDSISLRTDIWLVAKTVMGSGAGDRIVREDETSQ